MTTSYIPPEHPAAAALIKEAGDACHRVMEVTADLSGDQLYGPLMGIVNPVVWEVGHIAWFMELWTLRNLYEVAPFYSNGDELYNSSEVVHDSRWALALPTWGDTREYVRRVLELASSIVGEREPLEEERYFFKLATYHADMHVEALTYTRQTLGYPSPGFRPRPKAEPDLAFEPHDVAVPGGQFILGAAEGSDFVFDNEKWGHPVEVAPFRMSATALTYGEFATFADDKGYARRELWSNQGWAWRERAEAEGPAYWRRGAEGEWEVRRYDAYVPLDPHTAIIHVNWHEANAYCTWAGRRLPTEAEWELAAGGGLDGNPKRRFPWGDEAPTPERANLDLGSDGTVDVRALAAGDSPYGLRQMVGNVWEWTSTVFGPYPGFERGPYEEYSEPWFGGHMVLRGGAWATRSRLIRNTWRNFYLPDRRDVLAGFRTCAV